MKKICLDNLNQQQLEAVLKTEGSVLVSAGAGTGKTRVLTYRVAYLINEKHVFPQNILAITFTNKATNEMKERIGELCENGGMVWISTFHSLCVKILRQHIERMSPYNHFFTIYDDSDRTKTIKKLIKENEDSSSENDFEKSVSYYISKAKNEAIKPDDFIGNFPFIKYARDIARYYALYEERLKKLNALDFDDLILKTITLFESYPDVLEFYQNKFEYIHVDEFQDTNSVQYKIVKMLAAKHKNILVVGDEDQSIYGFRGANYENLNNFKKDFDNVSVIKLERNYRSTKQILERANTLINNNVERTETKQLFTENNDGDEVVYKVLENDYKEADYVAMTINRMISLGTPASDIAVLYRVNSLSRQIENALVNNGIAYRIYGGFKFFERVEIKNLLGYLRLLINPKDDEAFLRVCNFPKRSIGDATIKKLEDIAREKDCCLLEASLSGELKHAGVLEFNNFITEMRENSFEQTLPIIVSRLINQLYSVNIYSEKTEEDENRKLNIKGFQSAVNEFYESAKDATLVDFIENVNLDALKTNNDVEDVVTLSTVHGVKGLEFGVVFLIGCEEGMLPFKRSIDDGEIEEERRLCYVAITRARNKLHITRARQRFGFSYGSGGYAMTTTKSRFLKEMDLKSPDDFDAVKHTDSYGVNTYNSAYSGKRTNENTYEGSNYTVKKQSSKEFLDSIVGLKRASTIMEEKQNSNLNLHVGSKVKHARFGEGVVKQINPIKHENVIIIFDNGSEKELNISFAPIEVLE